MVVPQDGRCCFAGRWRVLLFIVLSVVLQSVVVESRRQHVSRLSKPAVRHNLVFRPLRRSIMNFVPTRTATVTLVFQRSIMPKMRWFRQSANPLPNAEIPNMITIEGDPRYKLRTISSHDITAVTLLIVGLEDQFPIKLVTCFSVDQVPFQYQLDTIVEEVTQNRTDVLDGIIWMHKPPSTITFTPEGQLTVNCSVRLESESSRFTDELNIYRSYLDDRKKSVGSSSHQLMSIGCGKIHKDRDNYAEESGKYIYVGNREIIGGYGGLGRRRGQVQYNVSFQVLNGSQNDVGVYTCAGERQRDRTYISSCVRLNRLSAPAMIFLPCEDASTQHQIHGRPVYVNITRSKPTCVRCRAYDYLTSTKIELKKDGEAMHRSVDTVLLDWHLNVADGGLSELTVTFANPSERDAGTYECLVKNDAGSDSVKFNVMPVNGL